MKKYIVSLMAGVSACLILFSGCTSSFEKVNTDPDRPEKAPATNVLAYVVRYASQSLFGTADMSEPCTFGGYVAKTQNIDESRYVFSPGTVENKWEACNLLLNNIKAIQKNATENGNDNMLNVSRVLEVAIMQIMTDTWRDLPYTEAARLDEGILLPVYDRQEDIYPKMLSVLKEAADGFAAGGKDDLGDGDQLYHGDINKWQQYCNSLRLRLAMRISGVSTTLARQTVEEIMGDQSKYPFIADNASNAFFYWPGADPYMEPWAKDFQTRDDHGVSDILINALVENDDPRLPVYAHKSPADDVYRGYEIGAKNPVVISTISHIGTRFREDKAGFSPYMRACESWFNIAEASKLGWNTRTTAKEAYEKAVTLSLNENGVGDQAPAYLEGKAKFNDTFEQIYFQEWLSLMKQGMEAWSLYRRTGVPTTNKVAPGSPYSGHNVPPFRYPYPTSELSLNAQNMAPFNAEVVDDYWGKQMWWDTRTNVQ